MSERGTVAVVGGGLAGITAALDLADAGAQVTLLEVRPRLGGAAYSVERDGLVLDNGQHVFLRCCTAYRALLDRLGSTGDTTLQERLAIPVLAPGASPVWLRRSDAPAPLHLLPALLAYRVLPVRDRLAAAVAAAALAWVDPADPRSDERSFGAWLRARGQSRRAIEAVWDLIGRPTLNLDSDAASLAAAAFVFQEGLLRSADAGDIGYATAPLQAVHGDPALRALRERGVDVRLGWRVQEISVEPEGGFRIAGRDSAVRADAVVLAVPHRRAVGLAPPGALRDPAAVAGLGVSPIVNLHIVLDRPVLDLPFTAVVGSPLQYVFDRTASTGLAQGQCLAVSLSAAEADVELTPEELQARYLPALMELLPRAREARVEHFAVTKEREATFRASPGAARHRPGPRTGVPGLALAGAWTDTGWPATMEGAVRSGHSAAHVALLSLGLPTASRDRAEKLPGGEPMTAVAP